MLSKPQILQQKMILIFRYFLISCLKLQIVNVYFKLPYFKYFYFEKLSSIKRQISTETIASMFLTYFYCNGGQITVHKPYRLFKK
jgi:hypothetical protein